jgi:hypothetical protein
MANDDRIQETTPDLSRATPESEPPSAPEGLSPEEQMELYEKQLKEEDWGHQPC